MSTHTNFTPLHLAAERGDLQTTRLLLELHADASLTTVNGENAKDLATEFPESHIFSQAVVTCLEQWAAMDARHRSVVKSFGWVYWEKPRWHQRLHAEYPSHLQMQVVAIAMSTNHLLPRDSGHVVDLLCAALDLFKRPVTGGEFMWSSE